MPRRSGAAGPGAVLLLSMAIVAVLALVAFSVLESKLRGNREGASAGLPTAVAPPDPGAEPPPIRLLPEDAPPRAPAERPQRQLSEWASPIAEELKIPEPALEAYAYAASALEVTRPECGLSWTVLAGIGAVESRHGRYGEAELGPTGHTTAPIRGIPLDGREGVQLIRDTDNGALDGDTRYDRAVGPLQFIPTTWEAWGRDADGDGKADPDDIDDAAMAAAYYLCESAGDLTDPENFWDAMLEYNASREYVQKVLNHADYYGTHSYRSQRE